MWKSIVVVGSVMNLFASGTPIRDETTRELTIAGYWTLNPQLSDPTESSVVKVMDVEGRGSTERAWPVPEPEEVNTAQALVRELLRPNEQLTVAPTEVDAVTIVDGRGISRVYQTSGRPEWQTFDGRLCETSTVWRGPTLAQEIRIDAQTYVVRSYRAGPESDRLIETVVLKAAGSPDRSLIRIYESDRVP